jgi:hypothetical protein
LTLGQCSDLEPAGQELPARVEAVDFHPCEVLVEGRRRPLRDPAAHEAERITVHLEQFVGDGQIAARRQQLASLEPDVRPQPALALGQERALDRDLALRDADTSLLAAVEIERHRHADHEVAVGADGLLPPQLEHRVGAQRGLADAGGGRLNFCARGPEVRVVRDRPGDQLVDRDLDGLAPGSARRAEHHESDNDRQPAQGHVTAPGP